MNLSELISCWRRCARGLSAIEFALVAPVLVCVYFGAIEATTMMITDRKLTSAMTTVSDLTARESKLTTTEISEIMDAGIMSMAGIVRDGANTRANAAQRIRIRVTSVEWNPSGTQTVVGWSQATANWSARTPGEGVDAPRDLVPTGGSVIFTEVEYEYSSITGLFNPDSGLPIDASRTLTNQTYSRPRRTQIIPIS